MKDKKTRRELLTLCGTVTTMSFVGCIQTGEVVEKKEELTANEFYDSMSIEDGKLRIETTIDGGQNEITSGFFEECAIFNSNRERVDRVELIGTQRVYELNFNDNGKYRVVTYGDITTDFRISIAMIAEIRITDGKVEVEEYKRKDGH